MRNLILLVLIILGVFGAHYQSVQKNLPLEYGAPPYIEDEDDTVFKNNRYPDLSSWKRPDGPLRIGLQAGHWKTSEMPDEQTRIRDSGGGTSSGKIAEWEVALNIANLTADILRKEGIEVDIVPATVPKSYFADAFVSIHADGNLDRSVTGFKVSEPRRDYTGKGKILASVIEKTYASETNLHIDPNISRNMTGYYAFSWWRYDHAVHPMTASVILETGFLTNPTEAYMLINQPEIPSQALAKALIEFLQP